MCQLALCPRKSYIWWTPWVRQIFSEIRIEESTIYWSIKQTLWLFWYGHASYAKKLWNAGLDILNWWMVESSEIFVWTIVWINWLVSKHWIWEILLQNNIASWLPVVAKKLWQKFTSLEWSECSPVSVLWPVKNCFEHIHKLPRTKSHLTVGLSQSEVMAKLVRPYIGSLLFHQLA